MTVRSELLAASDETIDEAMKFADPMLLRGLLYQLTGDEEIGQMAMTTQNFANFEVDCLANQADIARLQAKAATFLKNYRDSGAGEISLGPPERLYESLSLAAGRVLPEEERELWMETT